MLVDDHQVMRDLLRDALENTGEFQVVAQAADGEEAVRVVREAAPDVIVMDVIMPVMDGIDACREITELLPGTRVLMLTASNEQDAIVRSIAAGATGYLQKYSGKEQLLTTLREVSQGEFRIPGNAARRLARAVRSPLADAASERLDTLTDREREILKQFAEGLSYQEIGDVREINALTVRNAVSGVQKKLGFRTRQQMVIWAVRSGLVDGGPE
jgi:DNA-binding NarL/FixJ family response regulator